MNRTNLPFGLGACWTQLREWLRHLHYSTEKETHHVDWARFFIR